MELLKMKEAWQLYKNNYKWVMILSFASTCILLLSIYILTTLWQYLMFYSYRFITSTFALTLLDASIILLFLIIFTIYAYLLYVYVKYILSLFETKVAVDFKLFKSLLPSFKQYWDFWKVSLLIILGASLSTFALLRALYAALEGMFVNMVPIAFVLLSLVLVVVLFTYIVSRLFPATFISISKSQGSIMSIKEAWQLTSVKVWKIVGVMILIFIFALIPNLLAQILPYNLTLYIGFQLLRVLVIFPLALILIILLYRQLSGFSLVASLEVSDYPSNDIPTDKIETDQEIKKESNEEIDKEEIN